VTTRHYRVAVVLYSGCLVPVLASYLLEDGVLRSRSDSRARQCSSGSECIGRLYDPAPLHL